MDLHESGGHDARLYEAVRANNGPAIGVGVNDAAIEVPVVLAGVACSNYGDIVGPELDHVGSAEFLVRVYEHEPFVVGFKEPLGDVVSGAPDIRISVEAPEIEIDLGVSTDKKGRRYHGPYVRGPSMKVVERGCYGDLHGCIHISASPENRTRNSSMLSLMRYFTLSMIFCSGQSHQRIFSS